MAARTAEGSLPAALRAAECSECPMAEQEARPTGSHSSTSSGWSAHTAMEHHRSAPWPSLDPERDRGDRSSREASATAAAAGAQQQQQQQQQQQPWSAVAPAAAAACSQPWQLTAQSAAGPCSSNPEDALASGWQLGIDCSSGGSGFGPTLAQQQQQRQQQQPAGAGAAAALAPDDPWCSGLQLVAANSPADALEALPLPLHLTDEGLEALLAPFEDWGAPPGPCLLQPEPPLGPGLESALPPPAHAAAAAQHLPQAPLCFVPCSGSSPEPAGVECLPSLPSLGSLPPTAASPCSSSGGSGGAFSMPLPPPPALAAPTAPAPTAADSSGDSRGSGGKAPPKRRSGRPRVHHPRARTAAAAAASSPAAAAASGAEAPGATAGGSDASEGGAALPAVAAPYKRSARGPKPKYVFGTAEEAADARRERNRKAALESYYRKKEHTQRLQAQVAALQAENSTLQGLLKEMESTGLCPLPEASDDGIDAWLQSKGCPLAAAVLAMHATSAP